MKKYIQILFIIVCTLFYFQAIGEQFRQLSWNDLVPAHLYSEDPLVKLTEEQKNTVYWVINTLDKLPERGPETEEYYKEVDEAIPELKKYGIDITELMGKRKQFRTAIAEELNGQRVRIPGYLLPLEMSDTKVKEFLLVPYIGACIHVPPPPLNQIVYVNIIQKEGYRVKTMYEPVWVSGEISVKSMVKDLYLVDGSTGVNIGYTMQASQIEPYKK
ncbi:MAG: DUF3299 domain-containing protein [Desulfobacterales bacterium]|jgi:hypothetical protein|nr:hypothetical protein [Desulfobacter sp.]MDP6394501.1 DUF3299 domain-containing protein [Desulfobacterales bacterium]MDP6683812.1 DUF3299 domain-containing protein [Desulfobacterales bacterium]MDP6806201.1 DUF3299 domain-containing protein [Desulfobacterales bacterium]|tara:strand:+ start:5695 stop:6342 length:648 start_codon:yes stop_codon:yes gene_type:complete